MGTATEAYWQYPDYATWADGVRRLTGPGRVFFDSNGLVTSVSQSVGDPVISGGVAPTSVSGILFAAQPTPGTPVTGGTVVLTPGTGDAAWAAQLDGTFSSGSDVMFEGSDDHFVTTYPLIGYNLSLSSLTPIVSIAGPGPFIVGGPTGGFLQVRMRADTLHTGDTIDVRLYGSASAQFVGGGGGGGGGGSITSVDGGIVTMGAQADALYTDGSGAASGSVIALLKGLFVKLAGTSSVTVSNQLTNVAKETGGNLTTIASQTAGLATHTDAATLHTDLGITNSDLATINATLGTLATHADATTTNTDLTTLHTDLGTLATQATAAAAKTDLDTLVSQTSGLATHADATALKTDLDEIALDTDNLAGIKSDLDTVVAQTASLATHADAGTLHTDLTTVISQTTGLATQTSLAAAKLDLDEIALDTDNLAGIKSDLDTVVAQTSGLATQATAAAAKSDLDTLVTNTGDLVTDLDTLITQTTGLATHADAAQLHTDLTTTNTDLATLHTDLGTLATQATLAGVKGDLDEIALDTDNLAGIKSDLDEIALDTDNLAGIATSATTIATQTTALSTNQGAKADAAYTDVTGGAAGSAIALLKGLFMEMASSTSQLDLTATGTISAAQPTEGSPVTGATIVLAIGEGQSTWKAQLLAGGGGFTSATVMVADKSIDGGTTWYPASFKISGASPAVTQTSVAGPGPIELTGNASTISHIRIRCATRNAVETIVVLLRAGVGTDEVAIMGMTAGVGTIVDGAIVSIGAQADTSASSDTGTFSLIALFKRALTKLTSLVTNTSAWVDTQATGTVTNDQDVVSITLPGGQATWIAQITGSFTGTLNFEKSPDAGTTWYPALGAAEGSNIQASSATAVGVWSGNAAGFTQFRVRLHPNGTGTATILLRLSAGGRHVTVSNSQALGAATKSASASITIATDQGNIPIAITDGSDVTQGAKADAAYTDSTGVAAGTLDALLKGIFVKLAAGAGGGSLADGSTSGTIGALNGVVNIALPGGQSTWVVQITGTFVGTLTFQESFDSGSNYIPVIGRQPGTSIEGTTSANNTSPAVLVYRGNPSAATNFQVQMTAWTSGTATINIRISTATDSVAVTNVVQDNLTQVNGLPHGVTNPVFVNIVNQAIGSLLYNWNGGGPNSQNYDRMRAVLGLKYMTATISSGGGIGSGPIITTANPTGLQCSQWIWLLGGTTEQVLTAAVGSYTPGSATVTITSAIQNAGHTSIAYLAYDPTGAGPGTSTFLWDSILPYALALNNGSKAILAQADANGNMLVRDYRQAGYVALSSPPSATNVGTDTTFTFSSQVSQVTIENNSGASLNYAFDTAATAGSFLLATGSRVVVPKKVTAVHILTAAAKNVNGSSASNIVLVGEV